MKPGNGVPGPSRRVPGVARDEAAMSPGPEWDASGADAVGWEDLRDWGQQLVGLSAARSAGEGGPSAVEPIQAAMQRVLMDSVTGHDWPTIVRAHEAASRGDWRALLELDREWGGQAGSTGKIGEASFRAGQRQLGRMRPMRDVRVVQRYLEAIDAGTARGWHPVVYGMVLAVHAIPLRQGLAHHAMRVASVMARAMRESLDATPGPRAAEEGFEAAVAARIPAALEQVLGTGLGVLPGRRD